MNISADDEPTVKRPIRLFESDLAMLKAVYPKVGYNKIIRTLVRQHCNKLREARAEQMQKEESLYVEGFSP